MGAPAFEGTSRSRSCFLTTRRSIFPDGSKSCLPGTQATGTHFLYSKLKQLSGRGAMSPCQRLVKYGRLMLASIALSTLMMSSFAARAYADDDRAECRHRIERAEAKLNAAIRRHGGHSAQADTRRAELRAQRERCYNRVRAWWDGHERRWREDRDWDRNDRH